MTRLSYWAIAAILALLPTAVRADVIVVPAPVAAPAVSYYAPAPAVSYYAPPAISYYAPPAVSYYAPPAVSYYAPPTVSYYTAPAVSYYAAPAVSYYAAPAYYAPGYATTTRYGLFGRRVTTSYYYP